MDADIPIEVLNREFEQDFHQYGSSKQDIEEFLSKSRMYFEEGNYDLFLENDTLKIEECVNIHYNDSLLFAEKYPEGFCDTTFDSISCWPPTTINNTVIISCFSEFRGVLYDASCKYRNIFLFFACFYLLSIKKNLALRYTVRDFFFIVVFSYFLFNK